MKYARLFSLLVVITAIGDVNACHADDAGEKRIDFRCNDLPIEACLREMSNRFSISLVIDQREIQQAKIELAKSTVSVDLKDATFRQCVEAVLSPHNLICIERFGCQLITTQAAASERYFDTRVYQLKKRMKVERRMQTIMWSAAPKSWLLTGGKGDAASFSADKIFIMQSAANQIEIADMFHKSVAPLHGHGLNQFHKATPLETKLAKPATLNLKTRTLQNALGSIAETHKISFTFEIEDAKSKIVSTNIGKVKTLSGGLSLLLEMTDPTLTFFAHENTVHIATRETAATRLTKQTYTIGEFVSAEEISQLTAAIEYTIATDSWESVGGDAFMKPSDDNRQLVINQSYPAHLAIRKLFADLKSAK